MDVVYVARCSTTRSQLIYTSIQRFQRPGIAFHRLRSFFKA